MWERLPGPSPHPVAYAPCLRACHPALPHAPNFAETTLLDGAGFGIGRRRCTAWCWHALPWQWPPTTGRTSCRYALTPDHEPRPGERRRHRMPPLLRHSGLARHMAKYGYGGDARTQVMLSLFSVLALANSLIVAISLVAFCAARRAQQYGENVSRRLLLYFRRATPPLIPPSICCALCPAPGSRNSHVSARARTRNGARVCGAGNAGRGL